MRAILITCISIGMSIPIEVSGLLLALGVAVFFITIVKN
jgi:hypothetical protein